MPKPGQEVGGSWGGKHLGPISVLVVMLVFALVPGATSAQDAASDDAVGIARAYVEKNAADLGVTRADAADLVVTSAYRSRHNGVTHVNLNQRYRDLEVFGGHGTVNVAADGSVVFAGAAFAADLASQPSGDAKLGAVGATGSSTFRRRARTTGRARS